MRRLINLLYRLLGWRERYWLESEPPPGGWPPIPKALLQPLRPPCEQVDQL